jgi:predicted HD phosphohydrolase
MQPFRSVDEAWASLQAQADDGEGPELSYLEHQLQTAELLERQGADEELVAAGLLHDLGDGRVAEAAHAPWAAALVRPLLGERVAWLIAAHAEAKRYICTTEPDYHARLSPMSRLTLERQGGLMTVAEVARFAAQPWAAAGLWLRRCDDLGKQAEYRVAEPERFRALLERVAERQQSAPRGPSAL